MGSESQPLRNIGIYHNLPTFDPALKNLTAIITGANGISGFHTIRALLDSPTRWIKIYALSRRPPPESMMNLLTPAQRSRVQHIAVDFLSDPSSIASTLKTTIPDPKLITHVFFYSYAQPAPPPGEALWSNATELVTVNTTLLTNFLSALSLSEITPTRILLQTGAKNYGIHLGPQRQPCLESDPQPTHLAPNFYYPQEESLFEYCKTHPSVSWNVVMPSWIIGAVTNAAMNALHPFAIYAAVRAAKKEPLIFPADQRAWNQVCNHATARLTGYLTEWVVLEEKCADQRFNATDTSPFTADRFFDALARWYGVSQGAVGPGSSTSSSSSVEPFSLVAWAKEGENKNVWKRLMDESGGTLTHDPFEDPEAHFSCGDAAWSPHVLSMDKARKMGWTGYVDTLESVFEMYAEMVSLGMLPAMKVESAREGGAFV